MDETRVEQWNRLTQLNKDLYGSYDKYLNSSHPFDPYILLFNDIMDDDGLVRLLGMRLGFIIPPSSNAQEYFYWIIQQAIQLPNIDSIINMTQTEYESRDKNINIVNGYHQRLLNYITDQTL